MQMTKSSPNDTPEFQSKECRRLIKNHCAAWTKKYTGKSKKKKPASTKASRLQQERRNPARHQKRPRDLLRLQQERRNPARHQQRPRDLLRLQQERRNAHQHRTCRSDRRRKPVRRVTINLRSLASLTHEGEVPNASSSLSGEVSVLMIALGNRRPTSLILL